MGPRHVVTARHCIRDGQWLRFAPGYNGRNGLGEAYVTQVFRSSMLLPGRDCDFRDDCAVLVVDEDRMGYRFEYFGAQYAGPGMINTVHFGHAGYPGNLGGAQRMYRDGMQVHRVDGCDATGPLDTNAGITGGRLGNPLFIWFLDGGSYVFGVASAGSSVELMFTSGTNFVDHVILARQVSP